MNLFISDNKINRLYRYALSLTNHDDEAYDLVHDAILKSSSYLFFNQEAYLKKCIRNLFFDKYTKRKREENLDDEQKHIDTSFEDILVDKDELVSVLKRVNAEDRELLYLSAVEDYSYKEISNLLEIKIGTVMSRLSRCKEKIRRFYEEKP